MPDKKVKPRINLKLLVILEKFTIKSFPLLTNVYRDALISRLYVFEWHKRFHESHNKIKN